MLTQYGMKLGMKLIAHGRVKRGLRYMVVPVNYWRTVEFGLVCEAGQFQSGDRVLDIGSPKLLSLYLAKCVGARVLATDIEDYFMDEYRYLRQLEAVPQKQFEVGVQDGRHLRLPDASFDKVVSISVVEHIPDRGDTECIREIQRVLAPGGRCLITVPFSPTSKMEYKSSEGFYWAGSSNAEGGKRVFYQRRYSEDDLYERLINPSGLRLKEVRYVGERLLTRSRHEVCEYLPLQLGPIHPLASKLVHTPPARSWHELRKPLCAFIVLEKE